MERNKRQSLGFVRLGKASWRVYLTIFCVCDSEERVAAVSVGPGEESLTKLVEAII